MTAPHRFRSTPARVGAWLWLAFAALNLADIVLRGRDLTSAATAAVLLLGCGIAYVVGLRPVIVADERGVTVRNPLRDTRMPWPAIKRIEPTTAVTITFADAGGAERTTRAWALQTSPRAQAKAERAARRAESGGDPRQVMLPAVMRDGGAASGTGGGSRVPPDAAGRTPTMFVAQQLNDMRTRHRGGQAAERAAEGSVGWAWPAVASVAVPAAASVVLVLAAWLS
ncbi:PH domain-containing protein [Actinomadura miaoliensis]|uniref:Low molecular weight protein antigen 6 PH domain-containing protein n=1 Tax=Actinomadura miaoliensis TaxID=430685 RepID=A0ABP7VE10_9ACTN